jgi:hypothetical protein
VDGEGKKTSSATPFVAGAVLIALMVGSFAYLGNSDPTGCALGAAAAGTIAAGTGKAPTVPVIVGTATVGPACTAAVQSAADDPVSPARSRDDARPRPRAVPAR